MLYPSIGGRCSSIVDRVVRSTRVPIATPAAPMIRSPSQCPGTAQSATSVGRRRIITSSVLKLLPFLACPRNTPCPTGAQRRRQFVLETAAALNIERLADRLAWDSHGLIIGEVDLEPPSDLFRRPRHRPAAILSAPLPPARFRNRCRRPIRARERPIKPLPHILPQPLVDSQLRVLRTARDQFSPPLRHRERERSSPTLRRRGSRTAADRR